MPGEMSVRRNDRTVLTVRQLSVYRGATHILDDLEWQIVRGERWVILGANGSGKTSLLAVLTGYLNASTGEITVLGNRYGASDWRELRKKIGIVSSHLGQRIPEAEPARDTVISGKYAMIDYWGKISKSDRLAATEILREVEAEHLVARPWSVLSQGERQRIMIGRALMARPALLILDEPCAGLDPLARDHFLGFLERLGGQRRAPSLILVTHHVEEILPMVTHALLLKRGRVHAAGPIEKVLTSSNLSAAFGAAMQLRKDTHGRYALRVAARRSKQPQPPIV
jgi:iron complex transport system ATP-binding protein